MKWIILCALAVSSLHAAELESAVESKQSFEVSSVIAAPVAKLGVHMAVAGIDTLDLLVFSESEAARVHVGKGFALIHASWDFEAYRHFSKALKHDPECLMAYCGVVLSMSSPTHEFAEERAIAFNRMLTLAEHKEEGEFYYPEHERLYAVAIAELMVNGAGRGARVFAQIAKNYPNDLHAQTLAVYLNNGGYNALGNPRVRQRKALETVRKLVEEHPENQMLLNFLIVLQIEAPQQAVDFKAELLPLAQKLVALSGESVASWQALLGAVAWRSGELELAESAFRKSVSLYQSWKEMNNVDLADCEGLIRVELFLSAVLHDQGKTAEAASLAKKVKAYKVEEGRKISTGALALRWHAALMPAKLYMEAENYTEARKSLPVLPKRKKLDSYSAVVTGYQLCLDSLISLEQGKLSNAQALHNRSSDLLTQLQEMQGEASRTPDFGSFLRSLNSLIILHNEVAAKLSKNSGLSYNWYKAAIDAQKPGSRLLPPDILYPMEHRLGLYFEGVGESQKAKQAFEAAVLQRPSYRKSLKKVKAL